MALLMEAASIFETSVNISQATRPSNPEDGSHRRFDYFKQEWKAELLVSHS
jgi:hypothetical protein